MPSRRALYIPLACVALIAVVTMGYAAADDQPNLAACTGYAQPRIALETQNWWSRGASVFNPQPGDTLDGDDEHAHLRVCFPAGNQVVSGDLRFDLQWAAHNVPDGRVEFLRIQSATDQFGVQTIVNEDLSTETAPMCAGVMDCSGTLTVHLNTDALPTGRHELRFHNDFGRADGARMLATTGWTICVRSCTGVTPQAVMDTGAEMETRGRWREPDPDGSQHGYTNSRLRSPLPWSPETGFTPLQGNWCPHLRTMAGSGGDPVQRSFISVDPHFHAMAGMGGDPGWVIIDQSGPIDVPVCIPTGYLADGVHRLFVRADSVNAGAGVNGGVMVIPFLVANGTTTTTNMPDMTTTTAMPGTTTTTTTTTTTPATTTTAPPTTDPNAPMTVAISNVESGKVIHRWIRIRTTVTGPVASVRFLVSGSLVAEDFTAPTYDEPWDSRTVPNGQYTLVAVAVDALGNTVESVPVPVTVAN